MEESIHHLFEKVREHPDFAGGTIFVREDVATAVFELEDVTDADVERVTPEMQSQAADAIEHFIFSGIFTWADAMRENVDIEGER